jgi:hypothetical protein
MTTSNSPLHRLKAQADQIAAMMKKCERGEKVASDPAGKLAAARATEGVSFAVVMDDKVIKIEMTWATIRETDEAGISEFIIGQMRNLKHAVQ